MRVPKIYLETSALNFVFSDQDPEKKMDTIKLFEEIKEGRYKPFTSKYVTEEVEKAQSEKRDSINDLILKYGIEALECTSEVEELAEEYVKEGIIPRKYMTDALHIAVATVNEIDIIVSWNFNHIVKRKTVIATEIVNLRNGYKKVEIYSPLGIIENEV